MGTSRDIIIKSNQDEQAFYSQIPASLATLPFLPPTTLCTLPPNELDTNKGEGAISTKVKCVRGGTGLFVERQAWSLSILQLLERQN
jgi:hypothetical protein